METKHIFGNWIIIEDNAPCWIGVNYQKEAPLSENDVCPDWGCSDIGNTMQEAAISCVKLVWDNHENGGLNKAAELASALIMIGLLPPTCRISNDTAVIDGVLYQGFSDPDDLERTGIQRWNEYFKYHRLSEFKFSPEGERLAKEISDAAKKEAEEWLDSYLDWEETWINGPQW